MRQAVVGVRTIAVARTRRIMRIVVSCIICIIAVGWASQPVGPSIVASASGGPQDRFGDRTPGVVFVTSQGLYYDTFVVRDPLPMHGRFQQIENGQTEFGPGDPGYLGGRWWEDTNGNRIQDPTDHYFLCPLLPPGRETPTP